MAREHLRLSPARIKAARAPGKEVWLSDNDGLRGTGRLCLRVSPSGVKRFYFRTPRSKLRPARTIPLGIYSHVSQPGRLTLSEARVRARDLAAFAARPSLSSPPAGGPDRSLAKTQGESKQHESPGVGSSGPTRSVTLLNLCRAYADKLHAHGQVSARDVRYHFEREIAPSNLAGLHAATIKPEQFAQFHRDLKSRKGPYTAGKTRSLLSSAYNFGTGAKLNPNVETAADWGISSNPLLSIPAITDSRRARKRNLSRQELAKFLARFGPQDATHAMQKLAVRVDLLLGCQRLKQLLRLRRDEVNLDDMTVLLWDGKGRRTKPRAHLLPIVAALESDIRFLVDHAAQLKSRYLFCNRTGAAISAETVSKEVHSISEEMLAQHHIDEEFKFIDLRRTAETIMGSLDIHKDQKAQILSHGISGVQAVHYDMYEYLPEKRQALEKWAAFLSTISGGTFC